MKKIICLFLLLPFLAFPQQKDILSLTSEVKESLKEYSGQFPVILQEEGFKKKNTGLAIVYSLLLPGMGELYAENYSSGKYFTIAEGVLWGTYLGVNTYANWQKDRYKAFAESNGGINSAGKNDDFYSNISEYSSVYEYNHQKSLERDFNAIYNEKEYYWNWSDDDRKSYRSMWVSSEQSFNNIRFVAGALILNRVVSAINAVRLVSAYNKRAATEMSWNVSVGLLNEGYTASGLSLNFQTSF